jgi:hypothetical protein
VRFQHLLRIHAVDVIGTEHADVFRVLVTDEIEVLVDGVRGALEPAPAEAHLRRHGHHVVVEEVGHPPGLGDVPIEAVALVLREHGDAQEAAVHEIGEREIDDPVVCTERHGGLAAIARERVEALALPARENHAEYVGALGHISPCCPSDRAN